MVDLIDRYTRKLHRRIGELKASSSNAKSELYRFEEKISNGTYLLNTGLEGSVESRRGYLLPLIAYFELSNIELSTIAKQKTYLSNTQVKLDLYREVLAEPNSPQEKDSYLKKGSHVEESDRISTALPTQQASEHQYNVSIVQIKSEVELEVLEDEGTRLGLDETNLRARNEGLTKEVKRVRDSMLKKNLDEQFLALEKQLRSLKMGSGVEAFRL